MTQTAVQSFLAQPAVFFKNLPPELSSVSIGSCFASPPFCLLPLLSSSNYITAPVSGLQEPDPTSHLSTLCCQGQARGSDLISHTLPAFEPAPSQRV